MIKRRLERIVTNLIKNATYDIQVAKPTLEWKVPKSFFDNYLSYVFKKKKFWISNQSNCFEKNNLRKINETDFVYRENMWWAASW